MKSAEGKLPPPARVPSPRGGGVIGTRVFVFAQIISEVAAPTRLRLEAVNQKLLSMRL